MTKTQTAAVAEIRTAPAVHCPERVNLKAEARRAALRNLADYVDGRMSQSEWEELWAGETVSLASAGPVQTVGMHGGISVEYLREYRSQVWRLMDAGADGR